MISLARAANADWSDDAMNISPCDVKRAINSLPCDVENVSEAYDPTRRQVSCGAPLTMEGLYRRVAHRGGRAPARQ